MSTCSARSVKHTTSPSVSLSWRAVSAGDKHGVPLTATILSPAKRRPSASPSGRTVSTSAECMKFGEKPMPSTSCGDDLHSRTAWYIERPDALYAHCKEPIATDARSGQGSTCSHTSPALALRINPTVCKAVSQGAPFTLRISSKGPMPDPSAAVSGWMRCTMARSANMQRRICKHAAAYM